MQRNSRLAAAALAGIVAIGSLAATVATGAPALADDHRGGWNDRHDARDRGQGRDDRRNWDRGRDWNRDRNWHPSYDYGYSQPVYPVYPAYPAYPSYGPSNGYIHVSGPGWGVGFSL
jgi:hypothetical protein